MWEELEGGSGGCVMDIGEAVREWRGRSGGLIMGG